MSDKSSNRANPIATNGPAPAVKRKRSPSTGDRVLADDPRNTGVGPSAHKRKKRFVL